MSAVVIVGSGKSLLGRGLGKKIDSFENIIRFNPSDEFLDDRRYKSDIGSRMTIFSFNTNRLILNLIERKIVKGNFIKEHKELSKVLCTYGVRKKILEYIKKTRSGRNIFRYLRKNDMPHELLGHRDALHKLKKIIPPPYLPKRRPGRRAPYMAFTAGFQAVTHALERYDEIYLCGFDALHALHQERQETGVHRRINGHFYGGSSVSNRAHSLKSEAKMINKLIQKTNKIEII